LITSKPTATSCGAAGDTDGDGVLDWREFCFYNTNPNVVNTDGDSCNDGREVASVNAASAVDVLDLSIVAGESGTYTLPGPPNKVDYDVTKNGVIDVLDLSMISGVQGNCP
jgi:hypothetical protein